MPTPTLDDLAARPKRPSLTERYPIDHGAEPPQLSPYIQSMVGEPFVVAGGCNCSECVTHRIRNGQRSGARPEPEPVGAETVRITDEMVERAVRVCGPFGSMWYPTEDVVRRVLEAALAGERS